MEIKLEELAKIVSGELLGDKDKTVSNAAGLNEARENDVSFLGNMKYLEAARSSKAGVIFVYKDTDDKKFEGKNIIKTANPQYAYGLILNIIDKERLSAIKPVISEKASVSSAALIAQDVYIGELAVISQGAKIGRGTKIFPNVYVGDNVKIGSDCLIYPNVVIRENCILGDRVILQPGVVIGGDGFGFANVDGKNQKIPQIGNVIIGSDVEIGANTTVDRATTDSTRIGDGTKIDNLVQIAHKVILGKNCIVVALAAIAGSAKVGDNTIVGAQTGISGHLQIGSNAMISSQSAISNSVKDGEKVGGNPMAPLQHSIRIRATLRKLPEMYQDIRDIKKRLGDK
jgi:UDP-3-O-[3-hydroxymyristoyl] glucosamine N-acyltransferase